MRYDRFAECHSFDLLGFIQLLYDTTCLNLDFWVKLVWGLGCIVLVWLLIPNSRPMYQFLGPRALWWLVEGETLKHFEASFHSQAFEAGYYIYSQFHITSITNLLIHVFVIFMTIILVRFCFNQKMIGFGHRTCERK